MVAAVLLTAGIIIGFVVASDLGWLSNGHAVPDSGGAPQVRPVATAPQPVLPGMGNLTFVEIAKAVKPAVVNIYATKNGKGDGGLIPQLKPAAAGLKAGKGILGKQVVAVQNAVHTGNEPGLVGYWPMNDTACDKFGGCRFRGICSKSPSVRERFLSTDYVKLPKEDRWNPLRSR